MTTNQVGARVEAHVLAALLDEGYEVLTPFGVQRYDFAIHGPDGFKTVQCKSGLLRNGAIEFYTYSVGPGRARATYEGVDYFGVYCVGTGRCYLVPVQGTGATLCSLRVEPSRNGQQKRIRLAAGFLIGS